MQRQVFAGFFENDILVGAAQFQETRNKSEDAISAETYFLGCDAVSQELCTRSEVVLKAKKYLLLTHEIIFGKESFAEISALWITPAGKNRLLWVDPLNALIDRIYGQDENFTLVFLKPFPLEYVSLQNIEGRSDEEEMPDLMRYRYLKKRRIKVLCRFYEDYLGFEVMDGQEEIWMTRSLG